jgi:regulator of replication initiation timing
MLLAALLTPYFDSQFWKQFWDFLVLCHKIRSIFQLGQLKKKLESMVKLNKTLTVERQQLLHKLKSQV